MNENTKEALKQFANAVEALALGTVHMIGVDAAGQIINRAEELKTALDKDETLP